MGDEQFDNVSKEAGQGMGRRKLLKLLVGGAFAGLLAKVGLDHLEHTGTDVATIETGSTVPGGALLQNDSVVDVTLLSSETALPTSQRIGAGAISFTQVATDQHLPIDQLCANLLNTEARVIATFDALIARFPQLAAQFTAVRNSIVATINGLLRRYGCPGISTVATTTTTSRPTTTTTRPRPTTTTTRPRPTTTTTRPRPTTTTTRPRPTTTTTRPRPTTTLEGTCCQVYVFGLPSCCCDDRCTAGQGCSDAKEFFRCAPTFFSCSFATAVSFGCFSGRCNTSTGHCA